MKKLTTIACIWRKNMLRYLYADIICSKKLTDFRERSSRKTVSFEEQIMPEGKYLSIALKSNGGYCVYCPSDIFRNTRDLPVCHMSSTSTFVNWLSKSPRLSIFRFLFSQKHMIVEKVQHLPERKSNFFNSVKEKGKIQVVDRVTGNLTTFQQQPCETCLISSHLP